MLTLILVNNRKENINRTILYDCRKRCTELLILVDSALVIIRMGIQMSTLLQNCLTTFSSNCMLRNEYNTKQAITLSSIITHSIVRFIS